MPNSSFLKRKSYKLKRILIWFFSVSVIVTSGLGFLLTSNQPTDDLFIRLDEFAYFIEEGESTLVTFDASPQLGSFNYVSNNSDVVQFIENRLVAVSPGNATIMVSSQSNPSVFQTVSVIVRPKDVDLEAPVEPEGPAEPEPEVPVDVEPEVPEDPEPEVPVNPVDPDDSDDEVVTPPTIYTITITNETGAVITTLDLEEGSLITTSSLELPESFKGFYLEGETCEDEPFDLNTPITENLTLIQASFNDQAPCLQLDYIVLSGRPVAGTELTVDIFPIGANVTISWYTSVNNRTYREIQGESSSTFTVRPEDSGKFIRVYVVSDSNPPVVRYDTLKLDVFGTLSDGGGGSQSCDLISISNASEFMDIINNLSGCYELTNNIDLSGTSYTQSAINTSFNDPFEGSLDGNGFSIFGLTINSSGSVGLFTFISDATIENLTLSGINIVGNGDAGILAGYSRRSLISNVNIINSNISGSSAIGSVAGVTENSTIQNSQILNVSVNGTSNQVGGLVGRAESSSQFENIQIKNSNVRGNIEVGGIIGFSIFSTITQASFHGTVHGVRQVGGIIGELNISSISESFNSGVVSSTEIEAGGIVGFMTGGSTIENSYNNGNVSSSSDRVGGIVGNINGLGNKITNSYAAANVTGTSNIGAVGAIAGNVQSGTNIEFIQIYWNKNLFSGDAIGYTDNAVTSGSILGITNGAMRNLDTFSISLWDIGSSLNDNKLWTIGYEGSNTFPWLSWQEEPNDVNTLTLISLGYIPIANLADFIAISNQSTNHTFANGTIYQLTTNAALDKNYVIVNDIDLKGYTDNKSVINNTFSGSLDGGGFTLLNLTIVCDKTASCNQSHIALIRDINGANLRNLKLKNFDIKIIQNELGSNRTVSSLVGTSSTQNGNTFININVENITLTSIAGNSNYKMENLSPIFGNSLSTVTMSNILVNNVVITGSGFSNSGGLIAYSLSNYIFLENIVISQLKINLDAATGANGANGGIIGDISQLTTNTNVKINLVNIDIEMTGKIRNAGGVIGRIRSANNLEILASNIFVNGSINSDDPATGRIGGFTSDIDLGSGNITLNAIHQSANIRHSHNAGHLIGGFVGEFDKSSITLNIKNSTMSGIINQESGTSAKVGGVLGRLNTGNLILSSLEINGETIGVGSNIGHVVGTIESNSSQNLTATAVQISSASIIRIIGNDLRSSGSYYEYSKDGIIFDSNINIGADTLFPNVVIRKKP